MPVSKEKVEGVYRRLMAGEADAPADLIELLLDPLVGSLRRDFSALPDADMVVDAVTDSLFAFVQDPSKYDPQRGSLWSYLYRDARGDLLNSIERQRKRWRDKQFDPMEHDLQDRTVNVEEQVITAVAPEGLPDGLTLAEVMAQVRDTMSDPHDMDVLTLILQGERKSDAFSQLLGIDSLSPLEQRRIIKQRKDKIDARLRRLGERIRHERSV